MYFQNARNGPILIVPVDLENVPRDLPVLNESWSVKLTMLVILSIYNYLTVCNVSRF